MIELPAPAKEEKLLRQLALLGNRTGEMGVTMWGWRGCLYSGDALQIRAQNKLRIDVLRDYELLYTNYFTDPQREIDYSYQDDTAPRTD